MFQRHTTQRSFAFAFVLCCFYPSPAYAYLDPGSGSILLYALVTLFTTLFFFFRGAWYKLSARALFWGSRSRNEAPDDAEDIVVYSEGSHYWPVFSPVVKVLLARNYGVLYWAKDSHDAGLFLEHQNFRVECIGDGPKSYARLNRLRAKMVLMTTPQIDIMMLRRSKHVGHYAYLMHAPTDALIYRKFAFDYFDTVFCSGQHQIDSIRALESLRKLPAKNLALVGLSYFDWMQSHRSKLAREPRTILLAPTWGPHAMFAKHGVGFLKDLVRAGFSVIARPHPQMKRSEPAVFSELEALSQNEDGIELHTQATANDAMARASILITDLSGIVFDYLFVHEGPVICIDPQFKPAGHEAEDVDREIWELGWVRKHCTVLENEDMSNLASRVEENLVEHHGFETQALRAAAVQNFGQAAPAIVDEIERIMAAQR